MSKKITNKEVFSSLLWKLMERGGSQGINFVVSIILARLLLPEEYGLIALITIFITFANVFVQSGFNTALIQKKDADEVDFCTVFYISLTLAALLYFTLFFSSISIANFYGEPQLIAIIRVLSTTLFFGAINSIQISVISKNMQFKKLFYCSFGAIILSAMVGIIMAYKGFGVWALVGQQLSNQIISTVIMWFTVKWRPKLLFSFKRLRGLLSYGWKILASNLLNTFFLNLRSLMIGKIYSASMLGYFDRGKQFPSVIITNINGSIQSVMLPTYSSEQNNRKRVKAMVRRSIVTSSYIIFPMMLGLALVAEPLVKIVLTDKWLPSVPFLQIFCATYMLMPIHTANLEAIKALGYSDLILKIEIIKKIIETITLLISLNYGIYGIALGTFITSVLAIFINSYPNLKLLDYSYKEQVKDVIPSLSLSLVMGLVVYSIQFIGLSEVPTIFTQVCVGAIVYVWLTQIFKLECFTYLLGTLRSIFNSRTRKSTDYKS